MLHQILKRVISGGMKIMATLQFTTMMVTAINGSLLLTLVLRVLQVFKVHPVAAEAAVEVLKELKVFREL